MDINIVIAILSETLNLIKSTVTKKTEYYPKHLMSAVEKI
jgi:hypothetical protein